MKTLIASLALVFLSSIAFAESKPKPTAAAKPQSATVTFTPGTYHDWHRYFDEVTVVKRVSTVSFRHVDVSLTGSPQLQFPDPHDNSYRAVKEVLAAAPRPFLQGLQEKLNKPGVTVGPSDRTGSGSLLVRAQITTLDPGSQAARYWGGFGAGAARVEIRGEIIDGRDLSVLFRFKQERRAGFGLMGGGYHAMLDRAIRQIGGDVAGLLNAL